MGETRQGICGADCSRCPSVAECRSCRETQGCPYGKHCFMARYIQTGGMEAYRAFKQGLIDEINVLRIDGMGPVTELYPLVGRFVNLEYPLPGGTARFLQDDEMYFGAQVAAVYADGRDGDPNERGARCFGVIAREGFLLVSEYGEGGSDPELVLYKRR